MALVEWLENIHSKKCSWDWHVKNMFFKSIPCFAFPKFVQQKLEEIFEENHVISQRQLKSYTTLMNLQRTWVPGSQSNIVFFDNFCLFLRIVALQRFMYGKNKIVITLRKTACFLLHIPFMFFELGFADRRVQLHHKCRGWWTQSYFKFSLLTLQMNSQDCCSAGTSSVLCFSRSAQAATWLSLWLRDKGILTKDCAQAL